MIHVFHPVRNQDERIGVGRDDVRLGPETNEFERVGTPPISISFSTGTSE